MLVRLLTLLLFHGGMACAAAVPAFPGAEGFGATSRGGRGGRVIEVTTLNDSGPGSFRSAVSSAGPRIIVFRVGGTIELKSRLDIQHPFLTVAGQTAPGGGITLKGSPEGGGQMLRLRTHDVVMRHLRIRSGAHGLPGKGQINLVIDPLPAQGNRYGDIYNVVLDHLSVSWSLDENLAIFRNVSADSPEGREAWPKVRDVTVQRCLVAEGLYPHSTGLQIGGERVARDGRSIYNGGHGVTNIEIHHNLFANTSHRNPGLGCKSARVTNNVMYNWSSKCAETHDAITVDWIANHFRPGPLSAGEAVIVHNDFFKGSSHLRFDPPSILMSGNLCTATPPRNDWELYTIHYEGKALPESYRRSQPMPESSRPVTRVPAAEAFDVVLNDVGANARLDASGKWIPNSDTVDRRVMDDVRLKRGVGTQQEGNRVHYTHPDQAGGYATMEAGAAYDDADHDGMADDWERKHGLNTGDASDGSADIDDDGYTNVEEFLNGTPPNNEEVAQK